MQPILSKWDISWSDRQTFKTIYLVGVENPTFFYAGQENLCRDVGCRLHRHGRRRRRCRCRLHRRCRCRCCQCRRHHQQRQPGDEFLQHPILSSVWVELNFNGIKVT